MPATDAQMNIAVLLFDRITALDAVGPYEVLQRIPGVKITFVGKQRGIVRTDTRVLGLEVTATLDELPDPDVSVIPGGFGTRALQTDEQVLDWIRTAHETSTWTTSVCTGALLLGAAGLLTGVEATTHWAVLPSLADHGAVPVSRRVVEQGKIVTAAGVSAGIDMALMLTARIAGDTVAQAIQLGIEYDPEPPFDAGSVDKAPPAIVDVVRGMMAARTRSDGD